jgi:hypothetical protein
MTETNESSNSGARKRARRGLSLDGWSVALALGLSLLVWIGWIKRVPW